MTWKPLVPVYTGFRYEHPSEVNSLIDYILTVIWSDAAPEIQEDGSSVRYYDARYVPGTWELSISTIRLGDWIYPGDSYAVSEDVIRRNYCPPTGWPPDADSSTS